MVLAILVSAVRSVTAQDGLPIENLRIALEHHEDGTIKRQLLATEARVPTKGPVVATGVRIESFDTSGKLEMVVTAEDCTYDRESGTATSKSHMRAEEGPMVISGKGFTWASDEEVFRIHSDARVEFSRASNILKRGKKKK